jgi:tRNA-splicing ligase RtcB (3'-phosphate/5'-hydroxy nucleic acid ligase)
MWGMRVDGLIYSDEKMIPSILNDNALQQVANAAHLPGITRFSMAMPDIHWGYGLPIGGVIATDTESEGVITPGGVGYDINCGVRLIRTKLVKRDVMRSMKKLVDELFNAVPSGVGATGEVNVGEKEKEKLMVNGAEWAVGKGYGWQSDLEYCEENGAIAGADPGKVSEKACLRGKKQAGTLGSGNHFIEVQTVDEVYLPDIAEVFGIEKGQIAIMIHTGSRGLGHQVCGDYASLMTKLSSKYGIEVPDRQLSCVPFGSSHAEDYLGAMRSAANFAWCNRQVITHFVRRAFERVFGESAESMGMSVVYDVAHNIAKIEKHIVDGRPRVLCVHRKGATRALPPGHPDLPDRYIRSGQPVMIPGDMGRFSYLLAGSEGSAETFHSACHGAGRQMSRAAAVKEAQGRFVIKELTDKGIVARWSGKDTMKEEAPYAYKDVGHVVDIVEKAGIAVKVARLCPLGVVKG